MKFQRQSHQSADNVELRIKTQPARRHFVSKSVTLLRNRMIFGDWVPVAENLDCNDELGQGDQNSPSDSPSFLEPSRCQIVALIESETDRTEPSMSSTWTSPVW